MTILHVFARSRDKEVFKGDAYSVTSLNDKGVFDLLPRHENFISIIHSYLLIDNPERGKIKIDLLGEAVMRVYSDNVDVFLSLSKAVPATPAVLK